MKATIKETGEIVEVYHEPQHSQTTNIYKEAVFVNGRIWTEDELDFSINSESKEVDLEKELGKYLDANDIEYSYQIKLLDFARHFFELGLKLKGE